MHDFDLDKTKKKTEIKEGLEFSEDKHIINIILIFSGLIRDLSRIGT